MESGEKCPEGWRNFGLILMPMNVGCERVCVGVCVACNRSCFTPGSDGTGASYSVCRLAR